MRLDKYLSNLGVGSRSGVKEMIRKGRVTLNGAVCKAPEASVNEGDSLLLDGQPVTVSSFEYYLLHKPAGYLTANIDPRKPVVRSLISSKRTDLSPVGRLDEDTEGLLLYTNDGELSHFLLSPKYHVPKIYYAEVDRPFPKDTKEILGQPIEFKDFTSLPADFEALSQTSCHITLREGKYHEVKRLLAHVGCNVTYLRRISFGPLTLGDLEKGCFRPLTEEEVESLKEAVKPVEKAEI